jgi:hypothetical protein
MPHGNTSEIVCQHGAVCCGYNSRVLAIRKLLFLATILVPISLSGCTQGPSANYAQQSGVVSLAPGQSQQVWTGVVYRPIRVCNDLESNGTVVVIIDERQPATLAPGICTEDYGSTIHMSNHSASAATIVYRTIFEPTFLNG